MITQFKSLFRRFQAEETGAITVDFVVLVSAIIGLSIMVMAIIWEGAFAFTQRLNNEVESIEVIVY